ncbi:MAG TPA: M28 family peptidase [Bryobacteraceae bacterium]|nr:M28 family peptidase [Bryobacteraceae bacterium]
MIRRREILAGAAGLGLRGGTASGARGFRGAAWERQKALEAKLRATPDASRIEQYMKHMAAEPHHAGSTAGRNVAHYALGLFKKFGFDARIETFEVLLPYPKERTVELVGPTSYKLRLAEPNFAEDPDSKDKNQLPTYNAYSAAGDVTGELVYVNYGVPADYKVLKEKGIDVRGKVVLARYGQSWRGVKPKVAAEHGAIACLIYSDPKEDGFARGAVYPEGPFRCDHGVQRGSVMDMSIYVGDPLTPGWASEKGAKRLPFAEAKTLMPIPVQPISYGDAKPLLEALGGATVPEAWRGALPVAYKFGPGPAKVRVRLTFDNQTRPVHDVIAVLRGAEFPGQWVMYGNHHDAWVNGAHDPVSGAAALLETARTLGAAYRGGWRPRRTILFALWDAEEFGLIGSTEWVEKHYDELKEKGVVYFNSDMNGKGRLGGGASPSLSVFLEEAARDLDVKRPADWRMGALGSGSDYVGFMHHTGIASANMAFSGEDQGGIYHSIFDSVAWYKRFSDGTFVHGKALATYMAVVMARMSDADVPPFEFTRVVSAVEGYWKEVSALAAEKKVALTPLEPALARMKELAGKFEKVYGTCKPCAGAARAVYLTERALQLPAGLPGRPWYRNALTAPGQYTGYGAKTLPGVREALELGKWEEATAQSKELAAALERFNGALGEAVRILKGA